MQGMGIAARSSTQGERKDLTPCGLGMPVEWQVNCQFLLDSDDAKSCCLQVEDFAAAPVVETRLVEL